MTARKSPNPETKLAAALLALGHIPYEHAKLMTAAQMVSLYQFHHNIRHAEGGTDHFANLEPIGILQHRKHSAEIDAPAIAKNRDIRASEAIHKAQLASRAGDYSTAAEILASVKPSRLKAKRAWPKGRKIQSRGFARHA